MKSLLDIPAYVISNELSDDIWNKVAKWEYFPRKTIGSQYVRAIDSTAANIAEGHGRHFKKDKVKFFYYA